MIANELTDERIRESRGGVKQQRDAFGSHGSFAEYRKGEGSYVEVLLV